MRFLPLIRMALFFGVLTNSAGLLAQVPPPPPPPPETVHRDNLWNNFRVEQEIRRFREQPPELSLTTPQEPLALDGFSNEKILLVRQVIFENLPRSISQRELDSIAQRYTSQEQISLRDLYEMLGEIDSLFDARNVVGRAVLPIQDVEDGIVRVQIIEGKIGTVTVEHKRQPFILENEKNGFTAVNPIWGKHFVRHQFHVYPSQVLNTKQLEEEVLRFNRKFRTQLIAELEPGDDTGRSDLKLTAVVPQPVSGGYYCDNTGRETSGRFRNGCFFQLQNRAGLDESFFWSYDKTDGSSFMTMFGDVPITRFGTSFEMGYDYGTPKTLYGPLASLGMTGMSERYRPGIRQLIRNTKDRRTDLSFQVEDFKSETSFEDVVIFRERLTGYTFGISDTYRTEKSVRFLSLAWQTGLAGVAPHQQIGDFEYDNFHVLQGGLTKAWYPDKKWTFLVKSNGSLAMSPLTQSRIFQIGGMATVRGVPEGLITGDSGYFVNLEGRRLLMNWRNTNKFVVEAFSFFDHGGVFYRDYPDEYHPSDYLFSVGCGLNANLMRCVSATIGYGHPIFTGESHRDEYREKLNNGNVYFTVRAQF